jgi:hypothetical protein
MAQAFWQFRSAAWQVNNAPPLAVQVAADGHAMPQSAMLQLAGVGAGVGVGVGDACEIKVEGAEKLRCHGTGSDVAA